MVLRLSSYVQLVVTANRLQMSMYVATKLSSECVRTYIADEDLHGQTARSSDSNSAVLVPSQLKSTEQTSSDLLI